MSEKVAIYCRLSQEDRVKNDDEESKSIQNQKQILYNYAVEKGWKIVEIYSDEDYTGSDRNRPAFQKLIDDAQKKKFNIILCKSQSRFTREIELVEKYINGKFLEWGIRFISLSDKIDSAEIGSRKIRQLSGLINEWYLEDLSENIKTVLQNHQKQGRHIGSFAAYGYKKDPNLQGHLIIDEEAAEIVRTIYDLFNSGKGKTEIAKYLNDKKIPNPAKYKELNGSKYCCKYHEKNSGLWKYNTVSQILKNPIYSGAMVQHRYEKVSYKSKKIRAVPRNQWIIVQNCHNAIINLEKWNEIQDKLNKNSAKNFGNTKGIFAGKLRCMFCGATMRRCKSNGEKYYFKCTSAEVNSGCAGGFIPFLELKKEVWNEFKIQMNECLDESVREYLYTKMNSENLDEFLVKIFIDYIEIGKRNPATKKVPIIIHWNF